MIEIAPFGAGRIGQIHAANLAAADRARLRHVVDIDAEAYRLEHEHFLACLLDGAAPRTTAEDGRRALLLADAACRSVAEGRMVEVEG